jgi:hypothetical protein
LAVSDVRRFSGAVFIAVFVSGAAISSCAGAGSAPSAVPAPHRVHGAVSHLEQVTASVTFAVSIDMPHARGAKARSSTSRAVVISLSTGQTITIDLGEGTPNCGTSDKGATILCTATIEMPIETFSGRITLEIGPHQRRRLLPPTSFTLTPSGIQPHIVVIAVDGHARRRATRTDGQPVTYSD